MSKPLPVVLGRLTPAAEDGRHTLFDLADIDDQNWVLIGGQMVWLLAVEGRIEPTAYDRRRAVLAGCQCAVNVGRRKAEGAFHLHPWLDQRSARPAFH